MSFCEQGECKADQKASIIGRRFGRVRWSQTGGKTVEGSLAFFASVLLSTVVLWAFGVIEDINVGILTAYFLAQVRLISSLGLIHLLWPCRRY